MNNLSAEKLNQTMQQRVGWNFGDLSQLTVAQAGAMLETVDRKLAAIKTTSKLHESEKNGAYNGMVLAKQVLETFISEAADSPYAVGMAQAMKSTGDKPPLKKSTIKKAHKIAKAVAKNESVDDDAQAVLEDEVGEAESLMAAQDMVDRIQGMLEDVGEMLNEDLPPLTDSLRRSSSADAAAGFNSTASGALNTLMDAVRSAREDMANAVASLSGQEPTPMGADDNIDIDLEEPESVDSDEEFDLDDFEASDAAQGGDEPLGRAKRD
jgi:hypothetical protein